jgi:DNA-binding IclR family transcriptional regulator
LCIARTEGTYAIQTPAVPVGARQPLGVNAGGLALLSALPLAEVTAIVSAIEPRLSVYGELDAAQVLDHWERANRLGYALIGNFAVPGVIAVGLPVLSESGMPIAAISIAAIGARMVEARITEILPLLQHAAQELKGLLRQ